MRTIQRLVACLFAAILMFAGAEGRAAATITLATDGGSTSDLLDYSGGARVTQTDSRHPNGHVGDDMIGGTFYNGQLIFQDVSRASDRAWLMTPNPVVLTGYRLRLADDGASGNRGATSFVLQASSNGIAYTTLDTVALASPYNGTYGGNNIAVSNALSMAPAQFFKVTFTRAISALGVRAIELDGFGTHSFQDYFDDPFTGSGGASAPGSFASDATTASAKVSDYIVDENNVNIINSAGIGNPTPALNVFEGQTQATDGTAALHLNLTTVARATYSVTLQASMWGSTFGNVSYTLSASAFDGADTIAGTALGSDLINTATGFTMEFIGFTFVAQSTSTTLYLDGTIGDTLNHNIWIDNLDINEDVSTVVASGTVVLIR